MSEELLVRHCSPTLAGMKTGSMFGCHFASAEAMRTSIRCWNRRLRGKGLRVLPLRYCGTRALIYVYRPSHLARDLQCEAADALLRERGYDPARPAHCVQQLMQRMSDNTEFPHEVGLFLGYPPEDVRGFIERPGECKCVGSWKVYGDEETARRLFVRYKKCTGAYCAQLAKGRTIEWLTVQ